MKRFTTITFAFVALLMLFSCADEETFTTSLFCDFISDTDGAGYFESRNYYTFRDIHDVGRSDDITGMKYLGSTITFEGIYPGELMRGDVIRDVYIDVKGLSPFLYAKSVQVGFDNERISYSTHDDPEFYDFMWEVMRRFYKKEELDIMVYGWVTHYNTGVRNVRMRVTLDHLIDVTILDFRH
jgi:hypothetical protein